MKALAALLSALVLPLAVSAADAPFEFQDISGGKQTPLVVGEKKAAVLVFVSPFCPTSNAFTPEVNRIAAEYGDRFAFYYVEADADITLADAKKHAETFEMKAPVLLDPGQRLVRLVKATITPEVAVIAKNGTELYRGRINDLYVNKTKKLKEPKTHDLRLALDAIAAGKTVPTAETKAIGCSITILPK